MLPYDVFESNLTLPRLVYIVAPGPGGCDHYHKIPDDAFVIVVSKAIDISAVSPNLWMMNHADQPWFDDANRRFKRIRVFGRRAAISCRKKMYRIQNYYSFNYLTGRASLEHCSDVNLALRIGGSITGTAIQLAYNFGAQEIILCGADMSGDGYFDATSNPQPEHGPVWQVVGNVNRMIRWMETQGTMVRTLSPTTLDIPMIDTRVAI